MAKEKPLEAYPFSQPNVVGDTINPLRNALRQGMGSDNL